MRIVLVAVAALLLTGCASNTASPKFFAGSYYMAGDQACVSPSQISSTRIMCHDKKGNATGYRDAMTAQEMQYYATAQANQQIQTEQMMQRLERGNQQLQAMGQQIRQQGQQFMVPQTSFGSQAGYSGAVTFTQAGNSLLGSNGVTYRQVGSTMLGSDGSTCRIVGQQIICR